MYTALFLLVLYNLNMENKYAKLNDFYKNREFEKVIKLGKSLLNENLSIDKKGHVLRIIGRALDQLAVSIKNEIRKKEIQKEALNYFEKLKKINEFETHRGIGTIYHHQKNFKKAAKSYEKALKINPESEMIYNDLGNAYQRAWVLNGNQNYFNKAIEFYNQALEKSENEETKLSPLINIALLNKKADKNKEGKKYAEEALKIMKEINEPAYEPFITQLREMIN